MPKVKADLRTEIAAMIRTDAKTVYAVHVVFPSAVPANTPYGQAGRTFEGKVDVNAVKGLIAVASIAMATSVDAKNAKAKTGKRVPSNRPLVAVRTVAAKVVGTAWLF